MQTRLGALIARVASLSVECHPARLLAARCSKVRAVSEVKNNFPCATQLDGCLTCVNLIMMTTRVVLMVATCNYLHSQHTTINLPTSPAGQPRRQLGRALHLANCPTIAPMIICPGCAAATRLVHDNAPSKRVGKRVRVLHR